MGGAEVQDGVHGKSEMFAEWDDARRAEEQSGWLECLFVVGWMP